MTELHSGDRCILSERIKPVCVEPAHSGFRLFGRNHVVRVIAQHQRGFRRCHEACVESYKVEFDSALFQSALNAGQRHGTAVPVLLVVAVAAYRTAAVIPQDQLVPVCREVLRGPLDVTREVVRVRHSSRARVLNKALHAAFHNLIDLIHSAADDRIAPAAAAAGVNKQIDLLPKISGYHLLQVRGSHTASGFQIRAAQIDHDSHSVVSAALDLREFLSRSGRHFRINRSLGRVLIGPAGGERSVAAVGTVIEIEIAVPGTGGIVIIDIPVISCGGITAAVAAASSKQSSERTAAAQQRNDDQDDQRKSAHPPAVSLSGAGA